MPPLDWDKVMAANIKALPEDFDAADNMYELLKKVGILNFPVTYFSSLLLPKMQTFDF